MHTIRQNIRSPPTVARDDAAWFAYVISETESGGEDMKTRKSMYLGVAVVAIALAFGVAPTTVMAQQAAPVSIGATDIGGVVRGPNGPEAGVWVIAETTDLPTKMNKIVVTDDQGRYLIPDLPKANYVV